MGHWVKTMGLFVERIKGSLIESVPGIPLPLISMGSPSMFSILKFSSQQLEGFYLFQNISKLLAQFINCMGARLFRLPERKG